MSEALRADVIVAGAGMTGATAALALASGGLKVALIDALPLETRLAPSFDGRASAIAYSSFRMLKAVGAGARLEPVACRIEQILVTDGRSPGAASGGVTPFHLRFAAEEIAARSEGEPLGYMVENRWIRAALAEAVAASGITVLAPARVEVVETVEADARFARVRRADGSAVEAPLLVGAEGKNSVVL